MSTSVSAVSAYYYNLTFLYEDRIRIVCVCFLNLIEITPAGLQKNLFLKITVYEWF